MTTENASSILNELLATDNKKTLPNQSRHLQMRPNQAAESPEVSNYQLIRNGYRRQRLPKDTFRQGNKSLNKSHPGVAPCIYLSILLQVNPKKIYTWSQWMLLHTLPSTTGILMLAEGNTQNSKERYASQDAIWTCAKEAPPILPPSWGIWPPHFCMVSILQGLTIILWEPHIIIYTTYIISFCQYYSAILHPKKDH